MNGLAIQARFLQVKGIARGLFYLHERNVVHGDMTMVRILLFISIPRKKKKKKLHLD